MKSFYKASAFSEAFLMNFFEDKVSFNSSLLSAQDKLDKTKKILTKKTNGLLSFKIEDNIIKLLTLKL